MKIALVMIGISIVAVVAGVSAKLCLYDGWYANKDKPHAKRNLIVGCILAVVTLIAAAELVVGFANFEKTTFVTSRDIQLDKIRIDGQTETIYWTETGGEEKHASLYSVGLSFGAEEPFLCEHVTEFYSKSAYYLLGLKYIYNGQSLETRYTFYLPESLRGLVRNSFK